MDSSNCFKISSIILALLFFLILVSSVCSVQSENYNNTNLQKVRPRDDEFKKLVKAYLKKINKQAVKTIEIRNGDIIDCVSSHHQPAFDHLQGQMPMDPPEMPTWVSTSRNGTFEESFQTWRKSGTCPEKTIPIRRTSEQDVLRANSVETFGSKIVRRDSNNRKSHEHAVAFVMTDQYYGAGAVINVWGPYVQETGELSTSQIWVTAGPQNDQNTIEVGWQVDPNLYGDNKPRLFTYWTSDGYQNTGCYNLLCSGFIQTSNKVSLGSTFTHVSSYAGKQYVIAVSVYKSRRDNNWWLAVNTDLVGYWPSYLFTHLKDSASMVEFGGEVVNLRSSGNHTKTQMGSGQNPSEGYGRASYFRNLLVVNSGKSAVNLPSPLNLKADYEDCYTIQPGNIYTKDWGSYFSSEDKVEDQGVLRQGRGSTWKCYTKEIM